MMLGKKKYLSILAALLAVLLVTSASLAAAVWNGGVTRTTSATGFVLTGNVTFDANSPADQTNVCAIFWQVGEIIPFYVDDCAEPPALSTGDYTCSLPFAEIGSVPAIFYSINATNSTCDNPFAAWTLDGPFGTFDPSAVNLLGMEVSQAQLPILILVVVAGLAALSLGFVLIKLRSSES